MDINNSIWQCIKLTAPEPECEIWIKRDDLIHPQISGNKWRKLKYYYQDFLKSGRKEILTFGGAFSNHILATAAFGAEYRIPTRGVIRGREVDVNNETLKEARQLGMQLHLISRSDYKLKNEETFLEGLKHQFPESYIIPEGGKGALGSQGCEEILNDTPMENIHLFCAAGTGTTASGLLMHPKVKELNVVAALKGADFLKNDILLNLSYFNQEEKISKLNLITNGHWGGYGKVPHELKTFIHYINEKYQFPLDAIYTAKAFYQMLRVIENINIKENIVFYHSGGLQGNKGLGIKL